DEPDEFGSTPRLRFYEFEGTRDYCPWLTVPEALDFQDKLGFEAIRARNEFLVCHVREALGARLGLAPATPLHRDLHGYMTAFRLPRHVSAPILRKVLWENFRVEAPVVE